MQSQVRLAQGVSPIRVTGATLSTAGDAISAEVAGQLLRADLLQYPHANEQVCSNVVYGPPHAPYMC